MPSIAICVMACRRDQKNGCTEWFRKTIGNSSIPYRIFLGDGCVPQHDSEIRVKAEDSYEMLAWKVQESFRWALSQGYTHILKTDCDCHVWPERLLASDFEQYDYVGNFFDGHSNPASRGYASGAGYCLSRHAAVRVVAADIKKVGECVTMPPYDRVWAEDMFVGKVLSPSTSRRFHDERYMPNFQGRNYNGPTNGLIVLGNVFPNKLAA